MLLINAQKHISCTPQNERSKICYVHSIIKSGSRKELNRVGKIYKLS